MNVFVPDNARVRIWREESTGRIIRVDNNIGNNVTAEVVDIPDGQSIMSVDEKIEGSYAFGCPVVAPEPLK